MNLSPKALKYFPPCDAPAGGSADVCSVDCAVCGDGTCHAPAEDKVTCLDDCAVCGDAVCDMPFEDPVSCYADCGSCGDAICDAAAGETAAGCSVDCAECGDFSKEDIREELDEPGSGFASLCFRIFHRDPQTRAMWRRKACIHFRADKPD